MKRQWVVLWSLWAARLVRQPTLPVRVTGGLLRGEVAPDGSHLRYLGVPYATHPKLRFQDPAPEPRWDGIFEAIEENVRCLQRIGKTFMMGKLDCLALNVYTPNGLESSRLRPVMVFVHGGGFFSGSGSNVLYGPDYLIKKDVILVTINYRLNLQGFGCLKIKDAPGNAGLKDQVAALKWVQRNIIKFGGDPDNVTLFGVSAGSVSVSFHIISPMSKGLFHRAIMQSGSSLSSWALQFKPIFMAGLMARTMGYDAENATDIYDILMNKTDEDLIVTRVPRKEGNVILSEVLYTPCVEDEIDGIEPFLTDIPYNLLSKGNYNKVPIMIGHTGNEGLLFAAMENDTTIPKIEFCKSLPKSLHIPTGLERQIVASELEKFYLRNKTKSSTFDYVSSLSRFIGEVYFSYPVVEETQLYLDTSDQPVYSYYFDYNGRRNIPKMEVGWELFNVANATHADDLFYLFSQTLIPSLFEHKTIERMTTMWTNFAKYGEPTPSVSDLLPIKWHPADKRSPQSLLIDSEFSVVPLWASESHRYLREVYTKYRRKED